MIKKYEKGQSLFEIVLALGLITLILTAVVALASLSIKNSSFSHLQTIATRYSESAMESLREEKEKDWTSFYNNALSSPNWCFNGSSWGDATPGACPDSDFITDTNFMREVSFTIIEPREVEVMINVNWQDSSGYHEVSTTSDLTDY
jgi:Tfp pilus assembly protein PilV